MHKRSALGVACLPAHPVRAHLLRTCARAWHWSLAFPWSAPVIERVSARLRAGRTFLLSDHCELWGIIGAVMTYQASNLAARSRIEDQLGLVRRNKIVKRPQACVYCCERSYGWCSTGDSFNQQRNAHVGSSGCHREFCSRCPLPLCELCHHAMFSGCALD